MKVRGLSSVAIRALVVLGVIFATLVGASGSSVVAAQGAGLVDDTTYVLETTGEEVTWDDPWAFDEDISEVGDGYEIVALTGGVSSLLISVLPNGLDIEEARDLVLDEFQAGTDAFATIDRGAYDDISYSLDLANIGGVDLGVFTLFRGGSGDTPTFAYIFIGAVQGFSDGFESSQEEIAIGGEPIFNGVDGEGLQRQLEQNVGDAPRQSDDSNDADTPSSGEDVETPEAEDAETPEPGANKAIFDTEEETPELNEDAAQAGADDDRARTDERIDEEFIDLGVVSQGEYVSPQFGSELVWDETWLLYEDADEPVVSDEDEGTDSINLVWNDDGIALIRVELFDAQGATPGEVVEFWTSDEFLGDASEVVLEDSDRDIGGVVILDATEDGSEIVVYREVYLLDDGETLALITYLSEPATVEDSLLDARDGIELDGEPILGFFDAEEVIDASR
jgi:hypothetical protein